MWSCVFIFLHFSYLYGFLQQSSGVQNKQYLTVSEFIDEGDHQRHLLQLKFTLLASQLNFKFAALEQKINEKEVNKEICKESVQSLENINELTKNYTELQHDFDILHEKYIAQKEEVKLCRNITNERDSEITDIANLTTELQNFQSNQNLALADMERKMNLTISSIDVKFQNNLQNYVNSLNSSLTDLYQLVDRNSERVALLSNRAYGSGTTGSIITFNVHHSYGITTSTLSKFKSTGKFICEVEGLYLIATNIISSKSGSWFKIMKNQEELSRTYIAYFDSGASYHSGTGLAVITLQVKDTIYIKVGSDIGISSRDNTLSIIKIK